MIYCTKCGNPLQEDSQFCSACGTPVQAPISPEPQMPSDSAPVSVSAPAPAKKGSFVPAIVSLALSGEGIVFSFFSMIFGVLEIVMALASLGMDYTDMEFVSLVIYMSSFAVIYGLFGIAFGIPSLILGKKYLKKNPTRLVGIAKAGSILGALSIALSALGLFGFLISIFLFFL